MSLHHILTLSYLIMALLVAFVFFVTQFVVYALHSDFTWLRRVVIKQPKIHMRMRRLWKISTCRFVNNYSEKWGLSAGYQPRPQVVDRGTTARYGGQLRYI